jgi:hypothetical protein
MVLTMSPNNVSGPNNANEKTHGSPNNAVPAYAHTQTHTHTHTHTHTLTHSQTHSKVRSLECTFSTHVFKPTPKFLPFRFVFELP